MENNTKPTEVVAEEVVISSSRPKLKYGAKIFKKPLIWVILVILGGVITWFVKEKLTSIKDGDISTKYIAVIMSDSDPSFKIPGEFKKGFESVGNTFSFMSPDNKQNIKIEMFNDLYDKGQAEILADKLIEDNKYILIVGNSNSELTECTLNSILKSNNRPSFILPIATADNIIDKAKAEKYKSILRMVPNNYDQSAIIKRFIFSKNKNAKVAILVDEENTTYSNNLSKNIATKIIEDDGNVVLKKNYGNSNRFINDYVNLKATNLLPDFLVFVGVTHNGMLLIEELKSLKIKIPVIFTDGCTDKDLMEKAKDKTTCYFLSAVSKSENGIEPTYEPIGKDAYSLARKIINSIEGNITRESVSKYIDNNKEKIKLNGSTGVEYSFNQDGDNNLMHFRIYTYQNGELTEVRGIQ